MALPSQLQLSEVAAVSAGLGFLSHIGWFVRGQHLPHAPRYFLVLLFGPAVTTGVLVGALDYTLSLAVRTTTVAFTSFLAAVTTSMVTYRVFFHPLRNFPGPSSARYSQWWLLNQVKDKVDQYRVLDRLHAQYGEYVRVGPNLLSCADPDMVEPMHNTHTKYDKAEFYDIGKPITTLQQMRDRDEHDRRRKHGWNSAFTTKSLRAYDSRLIKYADLLVDQLCKRSGQTINATEWSMWYGFDIMGDLVFGRSFNALEKAQSHSYIDTMHEQGQAVGIVSSMPWIGELFSLLPESLDPIAGLIKYAREALGNRRTIEPAEPDVMSHLFAAGPFYENKYLDEALLIGDARLLIIAGSDTTASALVYAMYYIAKDEKIADKIRAVLAENGIKRGSDVNVQNTQGIAYLNAIINEVLRLHPAVPGGLYRETGEETVVNGQKLPAGVKIIGPTWTVNRSPRAFAEPTSFIPERWTTQPDMVFNKSTFAPFSIGKFSCIGKQLALNELRTVISKLVLELDFAMAEGETGHKLMEESKDAFTWSNAKFEIVATRRFEE